MYLDVVDLRDFYTSSLGKVTRRLLSRQLMPHLGETRGRRIAGLGFATPYLGGCQKDAERVLAMMPAAQGVINWPSQGANRSTLIHSDELPLPDASLDKVVVVHHLELAENPEEVLSEIWRVLAPGGSIIAVVPNRRGLWARIDTTPFGHGRPFSRGQVTRLMRETLFSPSGWSEALYFMPIKGRIALSSAGFWERTGLSLWPLFGGVIIVEATKQLYQGLPARAGTRSKVKALRPAIAAPTPA
jgi:SAM-dependent methyltransferase